MSRSKLFGLAALALFAVMLPRAAAAQSTEECEEWSNPDPSEDIPICEPIKALADSHFAVIELPDSTAALNLRSGEAFLLHQECVGTKGGMNCSAWPQEAKSRGNLQYQWSFESRDYRIDYPATDSPTLAMSCGRSGWVMAKLTISNGKYSATSSEPYFCGTPK